MTPTLRGDYTIDVHQRGGCTSLYRDTFSDTPSSWSISSSTLPSRAEHLLTLRKTEPNRTKTHKHGSSTQLQRDYVPETSRLARFLNFGVWRACVCGGGAATAACTTTEASEQRLTRKPETGADKCASVTSSALRDSARESGGLTPARFSAT